MTDQLVGLLTAAAFFAGLAFLGSKFGAIGGGGLLIDRAESPKLFAFAIGGNYAVAGAALLGALFVIVTHLS